MGLFQTVRYEGVPTDKSLTAMAERLADAFDAPRQWLVGSNRHVVKQEGSDFKAETYPTKSSGLRELIRKVFGLMFVSGSCFAAPFKLFALTNPEIRMKHEVAKKTISAEGKQQLADAIKERAKLSSERQGCEPISCSLCTIICLLCSISSQRATTT